MPKPSDSHSTTPASGATAAKGSSRKRDDFPAPVARALAERAGFICSNPHCRKPTIGPSRANSAKSIYSGEAAHITAAAKGGPRFDETLTPEERSAADNGIHLCASCADIIDKNNGEGFTTELLREWKANREAEASTTHSTDSLPISTTGLQRFFFMQGVMVHNARNPKIPFMAPDLPSTFVNRPDQYGALLKQLVAEDSIQTVSITSALQGAGGFGKTTLATALCHDKRVQDYYPDGILWVTLGEHEQILQGLIKLYGELSGVRPAFVDIEDAAGELSAELKDRRCLIVLDDVWSTAALRPFLRGGEHCTRLITTRHADIVASIQVKSIAVDEMQSDEAVNLLLAGIQEQPKDLQPIVMLAHRLGEWAILLEITNSMLREDISGGADLMTALRWVNEILTEEGVSGVERENEEERKRSASGVLAASFRRLDVDDTRRLAELAVFREGSKVILTSVSILWDLSSVKTRKLVERFARLSFIHFDTGDRSIYIHMVIREVLASRLGTPSTIHARLITNYSKLIARPVEYLTTREGKSSFQRTEGLSISSRALLSNSGWHALPDDGYIQDNLVFHMIGAKERQLLQQIFADNRWLSARLSQTNGNYRIVLHDLTIATEFLLHELKTELSLRLNPDAIIIEILLTIVKFSTLNVSFSNTIRNYAPELVYKTVSCGIWNQEHALNIAHASDQFEDAIRLCVMLKKLPIESRLIEQWEQIMFGKLKAMIGQDKFASLFSMVCTVTGDEYVDQMLGICRTVLYDVTKAECYSGLLDSLSGENKHRVLEEALEVVATIKYDRDKSTCISLLAKYLAHDIDLFNVALKLCSELDEWEETWARLQLTRHRKDQSSEWKEKFAVTFETESMFEVNLLMAFADDLDDELWVKYWPKIKETFEFSPDGHVWATHYIIPYLPESLMPEAIGMLVSSPKGRIGMDEIFRDEYLAKILSNLACSVPKAFFAVIEEKANTLRKSQDYIGVISKLLASQQEGENARLRALVYERCSSIRDDVELATSWCFIAESDKTTETIGIALDAIRKIKSARTRRELLKRIALLMEKEHINFALDLSQGLDSELLMRLAVVAINSTSVDVDDLISREFLLAELKGMDDGVALWCVMQILRSRQRKDDWTEELQRFLVGLALKDDIVDPEQSILDIFDWTRVPNRLFQARKIHRIVPFIEGEALVYLFNTVARNYYRSELGSDSDIWMRVYIYKAFKSNTSAASEKIKNEILEDGDSARWVLFADSHDFYKDNRVVVDQIYLEVIKEFDTWLKYVGDHAFYFPGDTGYWDLKRFFVLYAMTELLRFSQQDQKSQLIDRILAGINRIAPYHISEIACNVIKSSNSEFEITQFINASLKYAGVLSGALHVLSTALSQNVDSNMINRMISAIGDAYYALSHQGAEDVLLYFTECANIVAAIDGFPRDFLIEAFNVLSEAFNFVF